MKKVNKTSKAHISLNIKYKLLFIQFAISALGDIILFQKSFKSLSQPENQLKEVKNKFPFSIFYFLAKVSKLSLRSLRLGEYSNSVHLLHFLFQCSIHHLMLFDHRKIFEIAGCDVNLEHCAAAT